jgi:hypothetical protein
MATTYTPANDGFGNFGATLVTYGNNAAAVSPSDTVDFTSYPKAVVVTAAGNLVVLPLKAVDDGAHLITFTSVPVGFVVPFRVRRVMQTNTTASAAAIFD